MTVEESKKLALLEAKIAEQEKLLEAEHENQVDPSVLLKAQKSAGFSMQDIAMAMESIEAQLTPEQIETIRDTILSSKIEYFSNVTESKGLTAAFN